MFWPRVCCSWALLWRGLSTKTLSQPRGLIFPAAPVILLRFLRRTKSKRSSAKSTACRSSPWRNNVRTDAWQVHSHAPSPYGIKQAWQMLFIQVFIFCSEKFYQLITSEDPNVKWQRIVYHAPIRLPDQQVIRKIFICCFTVVVTSYCWQN